MNKEILKKVIAEQGMWVNKYCSANPQIPVSVVYAIIAVESGGDNSLIGDQNLSNHAYGLMQVRLPALQDFNSYFGKNYAEEDLKTDYINVEVGTGYLALRLKKWGTIDKAVRAYNAGDGNAESADAYAYQQKVDRAAIFANEVLEELL